MCGFPRLGAALTLLVFLPGIIEQGAPAYTAATGQTQEPFLGRWLLLTAAMFAISAVAVRGSTGAGTPGYAAARLATTRLPIGWIPVSAMPTSSASLAAQSIPTDAHRNHGPIVREDSSRTQPVSIPVTGRVEFGDAAATTLQAARGPAQHPPRITAEADVAVGKQHRLPAAGAGQRLEHVTMQRGRPAAARESRPRWRTGRHPSAGTPRSTSRATKRPGPQPKSIVGPYAESEHRVVEHAVGMMPAQPAAHRQLTQPTVVVTHPTPLAVQRPVVEIAQHVRAPPP